MNNIHKYHCAFLVNEWWIFIKTNDKNLHNTRRNKHNFSLSQHKTKYEKAPYYCSVEIFNKLPDSIKNLPIG